MFWRCGDLDEGVGIWMVWMRVGVVFVGCGGVYFWISGCGGVVC